MQWKRNLNKQLIDSFTIAMQRDQEGRPNDKAMVEKNVAKNVKLIVWTFENFGYPSSQKIGLMPMHTLLTHVNMTKEYPYVKTKLLEYVKSGDCPPISYAMMVDSYNIINKKQTIYGFDFKDSKDTLRVNRNRDSIGVPRLKHFAKIKKDFLQELKYEESKELH